MRYGQHITVRMVQTVLTSESFSYMKLRGSAISTSILNSQGRIASFSCQSISNIILHSRVCKVQGNKRFRCEKHEKAERTCKQSVTVTFSNFSPATGRSVGGPGRAGGRASSSGLLRISSTEAALAYCDNGFNSDLSCVDIGFEYLCCEVAKL